MCLIAASSLLQTPRMPILLRSGDALDTLWEELVYSEARLLAAGHKTQAASIAKSAKVLEKVQADQRAAWRREIVAQAHVDVVDDDLDDGVEKLGNDLLHIEGGNRKSARFKQYFKAGVTAIVRLGLESQIPVVRTITTQLATEAEKKLKDHGKSLVAVLKRGDSAVEERRTAAAERGAHRAREIFRFVDDLNALRTSIHAELTLHAGKHALPRDYADRFFRRGARTSRAVTEPPAPAPAPAPED